MFRRAVQRRHYQGYAAPLKYAPQWYVGNLVFKGGAPDLKAASITGGGQLYGHEFAAMNMGNVTQVYGTRVASTVAGGQLPQRPAWLTALFGGNSGTGS